MLSVKDFGYRGVVPNVMRYPRKPLRDAVAMQEADATDIGNGSEGESQPQEGEEYATDEQM